MNTIIHISAALSCFALGSVLIGVLGTTEALAAGTAMVVVGLAYLFPLTWFALLTDIAVFKKEHRGE